MERVLSGMQPTGRLHLGHYLGVLTNFVQLQEKYECFFMVANLHSLTVFYNNYPQAHSFIAPMVSDWLAAGIDPEKAVIFVQSDVKEHAELALLLSMYTPVSWLIRNPTYKEKQENIEKDIDSHGFLGYPVLQAADILLYEANYVPVGEDQLPHLELCREIARRFNHYQNQEVLTIPKPILSNFGKVLGTDGRKMSKSYGNTLDLAEKVEILEKKLMQMKTDTARMRRNDPGNPENCPVFSYYDHFAKKDKESIAHKCRTAEIGCKDCKAHIFQYIKAELEPFRQMREKSEKDTQFINKILTEGAKKAQAVAMKTMQKVKSALGMNPYY